VLEQDNIRYLDEAAKEFDEKFKAKELRN
jgi:hypothetical protein